MRAPTAAASTFTTPGRVAVLWLALNLLDALLTYQLLGMGGVEGNPLLAALMGHAGEAWALTAKVAVASLVAGVVLHYGRTHLLRSASLLMAGVVLYNAALAFATTL
jgi:hypothetical protein